MDEPPNAWSLRAKARAEAGMARDDTEWGQREADRLRAEISDAIAEPRRSDA